MLAEVGVHDGDRRHLRVDAVGDEVVVDEAAHFGAGLHLIERVVAVPVGRPLLDFAELPRVAAESQRLRTRHHDVQRREELVQLDGELCPQLRVAQQVDGLLFLLPQVGDLVLGEEADDALVAVAQEGQLLAHVDEGALDVLLTVDVECFL